jgi:hypothetical protein
MLAAVTALAKSLLTLLAVYGLDLTDQQTRRHPRRICRPAWRQFIEPNAGRG